ncbi:MAG: ATP-binding cassette domain-containing protein, partial [Gammaproteobacteria bacterium]
MSLKFGCGEIHGLVGENGAGKSTMLNIIAGTLRADAGTMVLDDQPFAPHSPRGGLDAGIARASQELAVFDTLSVAENIAFG